MRLSPTFSKTTDLQKELENIQAGYNGECRVDQLIQETHFTLPFQTLPNVEIQASPNRLIQIDSLIITPSYICVLEVKQLRGTLKFLENPYQLIQTIDGSNTTYVCPQQQILRTVDSLEYWLQHEVGIQLPIFKAIVIPNKRTHIEIPPTQIKLLGPKEVPLYLQKLNKHPAIITTNQLQHIIYKIKNSNKPYNAFPLIKKHSIPLDQLKAGIICCCGGQGRRYSQRTWTCQTCGKNIDNAIKIAMQDWFWLFKSTITHKECSQYLQINNKNRITKLLKQMNLTPTGHTRSRTYHYNYREPLFKETQSN